MNTDQVAKAMQNDVSPHTQINNLKLELQEQRDKVAKLEKKLEKWEAIKTLIMSID